MKVLVINCGSSSLKYQLIDSQSEEVLAKGLCERIGIEGSSVTHQKAGEGKKTEAVLMKDHTDAVKVVIEKLTDPAEGVIASLKEIDAVGHRIVHGGEKFKGSVVIDDSVLETIAECNDLAPLHNPANLIGIRSCQRVMPGVPMVAVFDTAFHQTMPGKAYLYGLPYEYYEKYKVRRYGFHGTSHDFVSKRVGELLGKDRKDLKIIVCHLGNGASVSAVDHGKSVDTSMGLTPLEGLMMGTRSGDMDPAIVGFIAEKENLTAAEVINICTIKPLDEELIIRSAKKTGKVVTAEEHSVIGGLGSAVCDALCKSYPVPVMKIGMQDCFGESGSASALLEKYKLDGKGIYGQISDFLK